MLKYISTIASSFVLFAVLILTAINYHNNDVLESRINTINKYSGDFKSEKTFKEDYYILQQSHDTNLILWAFGIAIAVLGFLTYQNIVAKFDLKISEIKDEIQNYKKEWSEMIDELSMLKIDFYNVGAEFAKETSDIYGARGDMAQYIYYALKGVAKTSDYIMLADKIDSDSSKVIKSLQEYLINLNEGLPPTFLPQRTLKIIEDDITSIRRLNDQIINRELSLIHTKLRVQ